MSTTLAHEILFLFHLSDHHYTKLIAPMVLSKCVFSMSLPPGVASRTLPRCRFILPRLFWPGWCGSSSLTPLWQRHSIVRFVGVVCPPCLCASMWCTWHLSAGTLQSGHGHTRFSAIANTRCFNDANRASYKLTGPAVG